MSKPEKVPDPRHYPIRQRIFELYSQHNPELKCPWSGHAASILSRILKQNPSWPVEAFIRCVENRFASDGVNTAADPCDWLCCHHARLVNYAAAPLDVFGRPKPVISHRALDAWGDKVNREAAQVLSRIRHEN